jgi:hypothetical protein
VDGEVNNNANDVLTLVLADVFSGMLVLFGPHGDTETRKIPADASRRPFSNLLLFIWLQGVNSKVERCSLAFVRVKE